LNPQVPAQIEVAIMQAMALIPDQRFQSMAEFKKALFQATPSVAPLTGDVAPRISAVVAEDVRPPTGPTTGPRSDRQTRQPRSIWKIVAPIALFLMVLIVVGGWMVFNALSNGLSGGAKNQTADAMAVSTYVQKTRVEQEAATLLVQKTNLSTTETAIIQGHSSAANETIQAQQATLQAHGTDVVQQGTQTAAPSGATLTQASPSVQTTLSPLLITDWKQGYFAQLSSGCKLPDTPCWRSDDDYQKHFGDNMVLTSRSRIFIDPSWPRPYLAFWHKFHFEISASLSVEENGTWEDLALYNKGNQEWEQTYLDLSKFKGEEILIKFTVATARWGSFRHNPPKSEWYLQQIQIIPDYSP